MDNSAQQPPTKRRKQTKERTCSVCKGTGHDKRNCPIRRAQQNENPGPRHDANQEPLVGREQRAATEPQTTPNTSKLNMDRVLYVVFDLETTGLSHRYHEIIEIAAKILDPNGIQLEDAVFAELIHPSAPIPATATLVHGITNEMLKDAPLFPVVARAFVEFMTRRASEFTKETSAQVDAIILVAYNGERFDLRFLVKELEKHNLLHYLEEDPRFGLAIDPLKMAQKILPNESDFPSKFSLATVYQFITRRAPTATHRAMADVLSTVEVFHHFFDKREPFVFRFIGQRQQLQTAVQDELQTAVQDDDSDIDPSGNTSSSDDNDTEKEDEEEESDSGEGTGVDSWEQNTQFYPKIAPERLFKAHVQSPSRGAKIRTGLVISHVSVNSPIKAWRSIFSNKILETIVSHTNEYGSIKEKKWTDITRHDLEGFISVLFLMGVQKRKDKPSNWFSEDKLLESLPAKKIMSGRKFFTILRNLHCCSVHTQPSGEDYDPAYKVAEFRDMLQEKYSKLFVPGQQLSLDETLVRAFGRMKFKVRIVSKAARYGIKIYVITDAETAFVLKVIIYTGKATYDDDGVDQKKTVQICCKLLEDYVGSHRTVYVDRFYTSVDLIKALRERDIYVTGTVMSNRIPKAVRIAKSSAEFKAMNRGDKKIFRLKMCHTDGKEYDDKKYSYAGLVCWRDRNMVYCLSNDTCNYQVDQCKRRSQGGLINIPRPISIGKYNQYMGGVDLADMRRLHCNSTIMGQNRWWLKLFFYLLDVGTSNALVLYNLSLKTAAETNGTKAKNVNIANFKLRLVEKLAGKKLEGLADEDDNECEHTAIPIPKPRRCAFCSSNGIRSRTSFVCKQCTLPLCCIGSGKVENDCFNEFHASSDRHEIVTRYKAMQKRVPNHQKPRR